MSRTHVRFILLGIVLIMGMVACQPTVDNAAPDSLPLSESMPTLLFFYTDN